MGTEAIFSTHNAYGKMKCPTSSNSSNNEVQVVQCGRSKTNNPTSSLPFATSPVLTGQSKENLEGYLTVLNDQRRADYDRDDSSQSSNFTHASKGSTRSGGGMTRSKTRLIFSSSEKFQSHPDLKGFYEKEEEIERENINNQEKEDEFEVVEAASPVKLMPTKFFGKDINAWTNGNSDELSFDKDFRNFIEGHVAKARRNREEKYQALLRKMMGADDLRNKPSSSIASNTYVPYPALRHERRFLYDVETYPLHLHLSDILGVSDLSLIHQHPTQDKKKLLQPLLDARQRKPFHQCYDNFVTSFCIPLLHSLAMGDNLFNVSGRDNEQRKIVYRYQAFPCIRVNRPGEFSIGPHCDMAYGHSMGNINFHIPLTPTYGTNALYAETHPGREDWHPLITKSIGLGYSFDGARCLHFTTENSTEHTRVSLDFRIAIHRDTKNELPPSITPSNARMMMEYNELLKRALKEEENGYDVHDVLCNKKMLQDSYSNFPGYYEEAYVDLGTSRTSDLGPGPVVCKRTGSTLMQPDKRVGFPF